MIAAIYKKMELIGQIGLIHAQEQAVFANFVKQIFSSALLTTRDVTNKTISPDKLFGNKEPLKNFYCFVKQSTFIDLLRRYSKRMD